MCGGQYCDTAGNGQPRTAEDLTDINNKKTGWITAGSTSWNMSPAAWMRWVECSAWDLETC